ncbi:MAG: hypothetical protein ABR532_04185 [Candidatus Dormibacteria bacterium]
MAPADHRHGGRRSDVTAVGVAAAALMTNTAITAAAIATAVVVEAVIATPCRR